MGNEPEMGPEGGGATDLILTVSITGYVFCPIFIYCLKKEGFFFSEYVSYTPKSGSETFCRILICDFVT